MLHHVLYYNCSKRKGEKKMTKDYMKKASMCAWTAYDFGYVVYRRGYEHQLKKMVKRAVRRTDKMALKKFEV